MKRVLRFFRRPAKILVICVGVSALLGLGYGLLEGNPVKKSVGYGLLVGGIVIFIFGSAAGGGARGERQRVYSGRAAPADMPFGTVLIGAIVFALGLGVLTL